MSSNIPIHSAESTDDFVQVAVEYVQDSQDPIDYNNLNVVISNDARYLLPPTVYRDRRSVTPESPYEADFSSPASSPQTRYPDFDHSELRGDLYQLNIASASDSQVDYFSYEQPSPALSHNSALSYGSASSFANSSENCSLSPLRFPSPNGFVMNSQMPGYPAAQDPTGSYLFLPTPNDILPEHQVHLAFPPTSPYSPSGNFPPTMFTQSLLVDKPPPPSPSGASDSSKHNLEESLNDIMTDIQAGNPTEIQSMLIQDVSSKAGPDVKHLFGKPAKASVCSLAGLAASGKRRKKPAKFACNFKDCLATFTRNAGLKSHYKSHLGVTDLECPFCNIRTSTSLDRHKKRCKQNPNREAITSTTKKTRTRKRSDPASSKA